MDWSEEWTVTWTFSFEGRGDREKKMDDENEDKILEEDDEMEKKRKEIALCWRMTQTRHMSEVMLNCKFHDRSHGQLNKLLIELYLSIVQRCWYAPFD